MKNRTGAFLSALAMSTALLAELAAPKRAREHHVSINALPIQHPFEALKDESQFPYFPNKALREPVVFSIDAWSLSHFVITKSHSYKTRSLFVPYIDFKIATANPDNCKKIHLAKQNSFKKTWTPSVSPLCVPDADPMQFPLIAFLEKSKTPSHLIQQQITPYTVTHPSVSNSSSFNLAPNEPFTFSSPAYHKPAAHHRFSFSSIHLQANNDSDYPWVENTLDFLSPDPSNQSTYLTLSEHPFKDVLITAFISPLPITSSTCFVPFEKLSFPSRLHNAPIAKFHKKQLSVAVLQHPSTLPIEDTPFTFTSPHMQPEKIHTISIPSYDHFLSVAHSTMTPSPITVADSLGCDDANTLLRELPHHRPKAYSFKKHPAYAPIPHIDRLLQTPPQDHLLETSLTASTQAAEFAFNQSDKIKPLALGMVGLTVTLPTLKDAGFTIKKDHFKQNTTSLNPQDYPKYQRSTVNLQALIEMTDMPLAQLVKSPRPLFALSHSRPRSIEPDNLEWINQDIHLKTLILGSAPTQIPSFFVSSAPDPRAIYLYMTAKPTPPSQMHRFQSQLANAIDVPAETTLVIEQPKQLAFLPSTETYAINTIPASTYICLNPPTTLPTEMRKYRLDRLNLFNHLIVETDPLLHPASTKSIPAQLQATLVADANHQQALAKKRLTPDQYIRKYGHFPTPEKHTLNVDTTSIQPISLEPIQGGTPYLWEDPSLVEDIRSQANFAERRHQRRSDKLNRKHRVTATNLARIPSLFDLETATLNHEFTTHVSWLPKTTDGKYLFSITMQPTPNTHFERLEQNVYFIIDNSTSINKGKASAYKSAVTRALPYIHKDDRFNIFTIDDQLHAMSPTNLSVTQTTKTLARDYLEKQKFFHPYKTSNVYAQLNTLCKTLENVPGLHTIYLFTDGDGLLDLNKHLTDVNTLITSNKNTFNIYPTCIGGDNHISFIHMLATLQRGEVMHCPTLAPFPRKFAGFVKKHQQPIARDLHAIVMPTDPNANCKLFTESPRLPTFYASKPLVIYGEMDTLSDINLMIQGRFGSSFVNISKKITFDQNTTSSQSFRAQGARFQAATYFLEFLQTKDSDPLSKTNALLLRYGGSKLL